MLDLTINEKGRKNNIERAKAQNIILPTYEQMMHPEKVPQKILDKLAKTGLWDVDPVNLFRITWKNEQKESGGLFHGPNYIVMQDNLHDRQVVPYRLPQGGSFLWLPRS